MTPAVVVVPVAAVCQYQVSPAGGVPARVSVTPGLIHCGELLVGFPGSAGGEVTVASTLVRLLEQVAGILKVICGLADTVPVAVVVPQTVAGRVLSTL